MAADSQNKIVGPVDVEPLGVLQLGDFIIAFVVDMCHENGFLQVVNGDNAMAPPMPGCRLQKGQMLALIPAPVAEKVRHAIREATKAERDRLMKLHGPN
jgi:DNA-binding cell septation regulator SpoVG